MKFARRLFFTLIAFLSVDGVARADFRVPPDCQQIILGIASDWNTSSATLRLYEKRNGVWQAASDPWTNRLGKSGLAWGRGIHPDRLSGPSKKEGDGRTPAGVFELGGAYGYPQSIQKKSSLPYLSVTPADLWVEDSSSPYYNRHIRLNSAGPTSGWEQEQQMRQNDSAHRLKLFIKHNAEPDIKPKAGSAIFFHVWRMGGNRATTGCTVMSINRLEEMIAWVDPQLNPLYVILPKKVYEKYRDRWQLP
ncbi:MAG: L,D-transpeptidase family protein [Verrucomicrobiota bacterium]